MHYDPAIAEPMRDNPASNVDMWALWDRIRVPALAIRGETSDLLLPETLARMAASGAETLVVPETGHAPALMEAVQIDTIRRFLLA